MRLSDTQKKILKKVDGKAKVTPGDLAHTMKSYPGPISRSLQALEGMGLMVSQENKAGVTSYSRSAEGSKIAKTL